MKFKEIEFCMSGCLLLVLLKSILRALQFFFYGAVEVEAILEDIVISYPLGQENIHSAAISTTSLWVRQGH